MPAFLMALSVAQRRGGGGFAEFGRDPILSLACIALIVVAIMWVVLARAITRNLDRNAMTEEKKVGAFQPAKDIWKDPP
jgi:hypothetical protein